MLRGHQPHDLDDCLALWQDPAVIRYTTGRPLSRQDVWLRLLRHAGHWALFGFGNWLAFEQRTGRLVGELGLGRFKRDFLQDHPELDPLPEAAWVLMSWAHGQGFASEALTAIFEWHGQHQPPLPSFCIIQPENTPSLRLASAFGYKPQIDLRQDDREWRVLLRPVGGTAGSSAP
ncbi:GNAT family N-acetyltransferase [Deinococcus irradiatisoli]|uniref:GNAT family N-acetyltransferase n=1 Tax=Deinococcus irradiatisoli TaxID=2202254 RepID=A0A2Z3JP32_9DEIO|nr:GNAT family N-acetyltransferase [Deinococcus irradiatisoli]